MATRRGASQFWPLLVVCAMAALAGALLAFWIGGRQHAPAPKPATDPGKEVHTEAKSPSGLPVVPLNGIERLVATSDEEVCAFAGGALACSEDAGGTWRKVGEMDARILAVLRTTDGRRVLATDDGAVHTLDAEGGPLRRLGLPPLRGEVPQVVDAPARDGRLWILAHRFDEPEDPMRLPRVVETVVFAVDGETIEQVASTPGFSGDRLVAEAQGEGVTFASVDARAWRYGTTGFRRIPDTRRFGATYGAIEVAVERWAERIEGPGRPARPASRVVVSRDGGESWAPAFHTSGEALVDFRDDRVGLVVARDEGIAWLTTDGASSFQPRLRDDRLFQAVSVVHVGGRFLVASADAQVVKIDP